MPQSPELKAKSSTVIFVDWDDTLLCSSFLSGAGYRLDTDLESLSPVEKQLKELESSVSNLLKLAMSFGEVNVVTNAKTGWVQLSAKKFLPGVVSLLDQVKIFSARSTYETLFPDSPVKWKFCAFQEKLFCENKSPKNVISFGDSHVEREAVRAVTRGLPNMKTKSVKFAEKPSMEQLCRQLQLVTDCFHYIHSHDGDLDLQLSVQLTVPGKKSEESTPTSTTSPSRESAAQSSSDAAEKPVVSPQ